MSHPHPQATHIDGAAAPPDGLRFYYWEEQDPPFVGFFMTGVEAYCAQHGVPLEYVDFNAQALKWTAPTAPYAVGILLGVVRGGKETRMLLDLRDYEDKWVDMPLGESGLYFKRCKPHAVNTIALREGEKVVHPMGPMFGAASSAVKNLLLWRTIKGRRRSYRIQTKLDRLKELYATIRLAAPAQFEGSPAEIKAGRILFQTRLWTDDKSDSYETLNAYRMTLIRELRKQFGARFTGGLVDTGYARAVAPELVTRERMHPGGYATLVRGSQIAIYSAGLFNSTAFKLAEYLAAGCCIVGEPIHNQLRVGLQDGVEMIHAQTIDSIVGACERLFTTPALAAEMRKAALTYYREQCEPQAQVTHILRTLPTA